jgi:DNA-directed RNA polymerase subunit RPC12/RpoP
MVPGAVVKDDVEVEEEVTVPKLCINCGQGAQPIEVEETKSGPVFRCPLCEYEFTSEHLKAPFARNLRL